MARMTFDFTISRSKKLLGYLILLYLMMAITLVTLLAISWWSLVAVASFSISFIYYCQRHQWAGTDKSITQLKRDADDKWTLIYGDGHEHSQLTLLSSFITPQLAILSFRGHSFWQSYAITITDDAVDQELFRQLRVYCRDFNAFQQ